MSNIFRGGWITCTKQYFGELPIAIPDQSLHNDVVRLVKEMLNAKHRLTAAKTDRDKTYYENKCAAIDRQIDCMVYNLYGLTQDEINLVESAEVGPGNEELKH